MRSQKKASVLSKNMSRILMTNAENDLMAATDLEKNPKIFDYNFGGHLQGAVEKSAKAFLISRGIIRHVSNHDISALFRQISEKIDPIPSRFARLEELTYYAQAGRYGSPASRPPLRRAIYLRLTREFVEMVAIAMNS